jgi:hypothetical protein
LAVLILFFFLLSLPCSRTVATQRTRKCDTLCLLPLSRPWLMPPASCVATQRTRARWLLKGCTTAASELTRGGSSYLGTVVAPQGHARRQSPELARWWPPVLVFIDLPYVHLLLSSSSPVSGLVPPQATPCSSNFCTSTHVSNCRGRVATMLAQPNRIGILKCLSI